MPDIEGAMPNDDRITRELLRHVVATIAYRGAKAVRGAPGEFADFHASPTSRTPVQVLAHVGDLFDWALSMAKGDGRWHTSDPQPWLHEIERFHTVLGRFDEYLASERPIAYPCERLLQGPLADALTHVGQLAMLRRIAGAPIKSESYNRAPIERGRTGSDQPPPDPSFEFD